jgi:hypothetical protein
MCCSGRIPDSDSLFRHCIHPLSFRRNRFAQEKLLKLYDRPDGSLLASLAWERYVPTEKLIHRYGCRVALGINEKKRLEGKLTTKTRHVYCGAYQVTASAIRALPATEGLNEVTSADVIHHIEEREIAHTDLKIVLNSRANVEGTKTAILDRLWNAYSGPLEHVCDYDKDLKSHPKSGLRTPPRGPYRDARFPLLRIWCIIRFRLCSWFTA